MKTFIQKIKRYLGIQWKLTILFVLISTIPLLLLGLYTIQTQIDFMRTEKMNNLESDFKDLEEVASLFLSDINNELFMLSRTSEIQNLITSIDEKDNPYSSIEKKAEEEFLFLFENKNSYLKISFLDLNGGTFYSAFFYNGEPLIIPREKISSTPLHYYLYAVEEMNPGDIKFTPSMIKHPLTNEILSTIDCIIPLYDRSDNITAILVANINIEKFFEAINSFQNENEIKIVISSSEGFYLYNSDLNEDWNLLLANRNEKNIFSDYHPDIASQIISDQDGLITTDPDRIIVHASIFSGSEGLSNRYKIFMDLSTSIVFSPIRTQKKILVITVSVFSILSVCIGYLTARKFLNPIRQLIEGTQNIRNGNFSYKLKIQSNDEIDDLADGFNLMVDNLDSAYSELENINADLERRVEDRTHDLQLEIKERKEAERALRESKKQLQIAERLAATGKLSASIAHEINNPLQAILANIGTFERSLPIDFKERDRIEKIKSGTNKIRKIIKKLLDIHRSKVNIPEEVDVNEVITSTLSLLEDQLFINKIEVKTELSNKPGFIKALTQELFQVFMNLILNSMDAMEDGGILRICSIVKNDKLEINFIDNGSGISEKDIDHIFEPFYTTKSEMLGTGLGLSTSKGIVESFNGNILVDSIPNKGATFKLIFPLSK